MNNTPQIGRLHVLTRGEPTDPPIILLHGFTGSAASWGTHLDTLAAAGMFVIAVDLPGHGLSASPPDPILYGMDHNQTAILAVLGDLGIQPGQAIVLGYSMGGRIALHLAFTGWFRALILESASPGLATDAEREARRASDADLADRIERDGIPAFVDYWGNIPLFASQQALPAEIRAAQRAQRLANSPLGLANSLRGVGTGVQASLWDKLASLNLPTLLITGALDTKFTTIAHQMADLLPAAQLHRIPAAGHTIHLEQPAVFDDIVTAFCHTIHPRQRDSGRQPEHEVRLNTGHHDCNGRSGSAVSNHEVHEGP